MLSILSLGFGLAFYLSDNKNYKKIDVTILIMSLISGVLFFLQIFMVLNILLMPFSLILCHQKLKIKTNIEAIYLPLFLNFIYCIVIGAFSSKTWLGDW